MQLSIEVWKLIFTYLRLNDLIEILYVCKISTCYVKTIVSMLKNLINQRKYLKTDLGLLISTGRYLYDFLLICLIN